MTLHHLDESGTCLDAEVAPLRAVARCWVYDRYVAAQRDHHDEVVAAIRATLPEFASRNAHNGVAMSDKAMDNLAHWVAGVVPWRLYRHECPANMAGIPCACPGTCHRWHSVDDEP